MKCEEALTRISAYIDNTLSGRELEEFIEHVSIARSAMMNWRLTIPSKWESIIWNRTGRTRTIFHRC